MVVAATALQLYSSAGLRATQQDSQFSAIVKQSIQRPMPVRMTIVFRPGRLRQGVTCFINGICTNEAKPITHQQIVVHDSFILRESARERVGSMKIDRRDSLAD